MKVSPDQLERIREATNIVDLVSEHVRLKKRGRNFIGLCPFHSEKTPSFNVLEERGIFKCFGCGKGGDVFSFVMEVEGLTFPEAIRKLAERAHIEIEGTEAADDDAKRSERESILHALREAAAFYYRALRSPIGEVAQTYLRTRALDYEILRKFGIGFAPEEQGLLTKHLTKHGIELETLERAGLIGRRDSGETYERFRGRLIFPVFNKTGRIEGFGGRIIPALTKKSGATMAKYINSPDTEVYHKSQILYGLFQAKDAIRKAEFAILVEGYADVLAVSQSGIQNVVAASGTSLTVEQLQLLRGYTTNIVLLFDADAAGKNATIRGIELAIEAGFDVNTVVLPSGEDPDSFIRLNGSDAFESALKNRQTFIETKAQIFEEQGDFRDPASKTKAIESIIDTIRRVPSEIKQQLYIQILSERFDLPFTLLSNELAKQVARSAYYNKGFEKGKRRLQKNESHSEEMEARIILHPSSMVSDPTPNISRHEQALLKVLLTDIVGVSRTIESFDFDFDECIKYERLRELIGSIIQQVQEGNPPTFESLLDEYRYKAGYQDLLIANTIVDSYSSFNWDAAPLEKSSSVIEAEQILYALQRIQNDRKINALLIDIQRIQIERIKEILNKTVHYSDDVLVEVDVIMQHPAMVQRHTQKISREEDFDA